MSGPPIYATTGQRIWYYGFRVICGVIFFFLIAPIVTIIPLSFNAENFFTFTPGMLRFEADAYSLEHYHDFFTNPDWQNALWNSLSIAPAATLRDADPGRIGLDVQRCMQNARQIVPRLASLRQKVAEVFALSAADFTESSDPDHMLYSGGFFPPSDRHLMNKILAIAPKDLGRHLWTFQDSRLSLMLFRYRARNYPETLSMDELDLWNRDRRARLVETDDPAYFGRNDFQAALATARQSHEADSGALRLLDKLEAWLLESGISDL